MEPRTRGGLGALVTLQVRAAIEGADVIVHLVDGRLGVTEADATIARELRGRDNVVLAVNKLDNPADDSGRYPFYSLGEGKPYAISTTHGIGTGDLLDLIVSLLPEREEVEEEAELPSVAVVGRPNVGKSTLLNRLLGSERAVVCEEAGTTTDAVAHEIEVNGAAMDGRLIERFLLLDTAGVSRSTRRAQGVPYYSAVRTEGALRRSDVSLLLVDAVEGLVGDDLRLAKKVEEAGRAYGVLINKCDLVPPKRLAEIKGTIAYRMTDLKPPTLAISALTGAGTEEVIPFASRMYAAYSMRVPTHKVAEFVNCLVERSMPPGGVKIRYAAQTGTAPPRFTVFATRPEDISEGYLRYLENALRERYGLRGVSVRLLVRSSR
jgi:GTP-binding protein